MLPINFNMKFFIVLFICIVAVLGESNDQRQEKIDERLRNASNACVRTMNRDQRFILTTGRPSNHCLVNDPNFITCIYKILGVMNEDAVFNLDVMLSLGATPEDKESIEDVYYNRVMKNCSPKSIGHDACKMTACVLELPESLCGKEPQDGC